MRPHLSLSKTNKRQRQGLRKMVLIDIP
jgi:hypothetical protein